ncbi:MAG TPA: hypothetical protein VH330_12235 [Candidatus Udaeobacter sp.]|jgi:hypothetical protein
MKSLLPKAKHLLAVLAPVAVVAVSSVAHLAAQSAITLPAKVDGDTSGLSVELTSVQKTGDTITIRFKYINSSDKGIYMLGQIGGQVDDKIYYVDAKNKKKYLVIRDSEQKALASAMHDLDLKAGETKGCWAKFPAPPADTAAISVYIPGAPPFENVPLAQ